MWGIRPIRLWRWRRYEPVRWQFFSFPNEPYVSVIPSVSPIYHSPVSRCRSYLQNSRKWWASPFRPIEQTSPFWEQMPGEVYCCSQWPNAVTNVPSFILSNISCRFWPIRSLEFSTVSGSSRIFNGQSTNMRSWTNH